MNIILLSGGSGKRLWPLSNDVRSKQFIKLFKDENGNYESMVQRVYRQVTTVDANAKITIATSKSQASAIKNQLGEKVAICVEPCRRDTFPAIALAASYLHDELGVGENEAVVVCPVDPYVDNTYYEAVGKLQKLAEEGKSNLTLLGIEPTYPSEKYGYIIPVSGENVSVVSEFKEKPNTETAKKYMTQKALWNAGIFAFKLGYLLNTAHKMIEFEDYRDLFNKYDTLTKISFDYAVVEKEQSIQVFRYRGDWKDVGTWNMMAEVMADQTKGRAILDETCVNTNIVNELIINLAAISSVGASWGIPQITMSVNVIGALNIMEAARKIDNRPKVMFIGSSEEYAVSDKPMNEQTILNANNPYGISKMAQEKFAEVYRERYGMQIYCVRPFNHTGIGQRDSFVLPSFCKQAAVIERSGKPGTIKVGNLAAERDFSDVRDIVRAYRMIIENSDCTRIYNVGSGKAYKLSELLNYIVSLSKQKITVEIDPERFRPVDTQVICCNHELISKELGWKPKYSIFDTLKGMFDSYLCNI